MCLVINLMIMVYILDIIVILHLWCGQTNGLRVRMLVCTIAAWQQGSIIAWYVLYICAAANMYGYEKLLFVMTKVIYYVVEIFKCVNIGITHE